MRQILLILFSIVLLSSECDVNDLPSGLSEDEIIEGLKTALTVGTDSSSTALSLVNGYYGDALVKIPLPDEAIAVQNALNKYSTIISIIESAGIDFDKQFENVVLSVNRAAEDAAKDAAPIFKDAITGLSITQGLEILDGQVPSGTKSTGFDSTAATQFLSLQTYDPLTDLYAPKINTSLSKDLGLGFSAVDAWDLLTSTYNSFLGRSDVQLAISTASLFGQDINLPSGIETDLGVFSTEKALDGLFFKVGETEKKIRRDPWEWISTTVGDILTKVFG